MHRSAQPSRAAQRRRTGRPHGRVRGQARVATGQLEWRSGAGIVKEAIDELDRLELDRPASTRDR